MMKATFGELPTQATFFLEERSQEYEKIALKDIREIYTWARECSLVNCRMLHAWGPKGYLFLSEDQEVLIEQENLCVIDASNVFPPQKCSSSRRKSVENKLLRAFFYSLRKKAEKGWPEGQPFLSVLEKENP